MFIILSIFSTPTISLHFPPFSEEPYNFFAKFSDNAHEYKDFNLRDE